MEGKLHSKKLWTLSFYYAKKGHHQPYAECTIIYFLICRFHTLHQTTSQKNFTQIAAEGEKSCLESRWNEIYLGPYFSPLPLHLTLFLSVFLSPTSSSSRFLFPALCWLARLQSWGTPEIQISWHLFGQTRQAAYASQVMCIQTCNLQIINVVLISHINSCHFVGIVSPRQSPGLLPATSASETARAIFLLRTESGAWEERRAAGGHTLAHTNTQSSYRHLNLTKNTE